MNLYQLYEHDIVAWAEQTVAYLQTGRFLVEEIAALGLSYWWCLSSICSSVCMYGWERTIRTQRAALKALLDMAPSLVSRWDESWAKANVREEYPQVTFPALWPWPNTPAVFGTNPAYRV